MDNGLRKNHLKKLEEILLFAAVMAGLLIMVVHWK